MRKQYLILGAIIPVLIALLRASSSFADNAPSALEILGHLPSATHVAISPDGSRLAVVNASEQNPRLMTITLNDFKIASSKEINDVELINVDWADNRNLLLTLSTYSHTRGTVGGHLSDLYMLASYNLEKDKIVNPLTVLNGSNRDMFMSREIVGAPVFRKQEDNVTVVVPGLSAGEESKNASGQRFLMPTLFKFKAGINSTSFVVRSTDSNTQWLIDEKGHELCSYFYEEDSQKWILNVLINGHWKKVLSEVFSIDMPEMIGVSPDGAALWLSVPRADGNGYSGMSISLQDGAIKRDVAEIEKYTGFIVSRYSPRIIAGYRRGDGNIEFFDSSKEESWQVIQNNYNSARVDFISASDDFKKIVFKVEGRDSGYGYGLFDADSFKFTSLFSVYDALTQLADVKRVNYQAEDKLPLSAYVTFPSGPRKNRAMIVIAHDGPDSHVDGGFDYLAQLLAAEGYLVVQPNFRGSDISAEARAAGYGEWGRKMQSDISDLVKILVKGGVADSSRVCIVGTGYGGYAALTAIAQNKDMYHCAVSIGGISEISSFRKSVKAGSNGLVSADLRQLDRYLGSAAANESQLAALSPVNFASQISSPVLLLHGMNDSVVPFKQSELMAESLKKAKQDVSFVPLEKEDHYLSSSATRFQAMKAMLEFLKKYNPADEAPH